MGLTLAIVGGALSLAGLIARRIKRKRAKPVAEVLETAGKIVNQLPRK